MIRRVAGNLYRATNRGMKPLKTHRRKNTQSHAEILEDRCLLHAGHLIETFAGASAINTGAAVAENFDDVNYNHVLTNFPIGGAPATVESGGGRRVIF